ncbi:MAG: endonuclease/exonuclease/phosphatase family protein, partial [Candidatus Eisenbacteria bacterium]|nr:endonuclease/exonuclease/phosphatase family protein [Candidatus Eisenbacteria bacterium]
MNRLLGGAVALGGLLLLGCPNPQNYNLIQEPRYAGCGSETIPDPASLAIRSSAALKHVGEVSIASFNIKFSKEIERATAVLLRNPMLREADILLLQEMDVEGVARIAKALDRCWVYYPATRHPQTKRDFGNAILSRFPIQDDHKVIFPHLGQFGRTQRIAAAATLLINGQAVRVYSLHVATQIELGPQRREAQVQAVIDDARSFDGPVIVGGDLNDYRLGHVFKDAGYHWNTR